MTYKQAAEVKAQVRKGAQGSLVVYADTFKKTDTC
jgi:antirestriction protein ArdC